VYLLSKSVHSGYYAPEEINIHKPLCVTSVLARAEPTAGPDRAGRTLLHSGGPAIKS
jgi:hypothetical protein